MKDLSSIYLMNLSQCKPQFALSDKSQKYKWKTVNYKSEIGEGTLLLAGPESEAPWVELPLHIDGEYYIYLGLWGRGLGQMESFSLKVKLSNDDTYTSVDREDYNPYCISERFWKKAELNGKSSILFGQRNVANQPAVAAIAYVKLVPVKENEEFDSLQKFNDGKLIGLNDAFSFIGRHRPVTEEEIWAQLEPFKDSQFNRIYWCSGAGPDVCTYPTQTGKLFGEGVDNFTRPVDRNIAESLQILLRKGIDPLASALKYTHSIGKKFSVSFRMGAFQLEPPLDEVMLSPFYQKHPEFRCKDINGKEVSRLSYAYSEVREYVLSLIEEVLKKYQVDGIHLIFVRGGPFVLYEPPVLEQYYRKTGENFDKEKFAEKEIATVWIDYMTDFMRSVNKLVTDYTNGKTLEIAAHVMHDVETNLSFGLDLEKWIDENLVDVIIPYPWRGRSSEKIKIKQFADISNKKKVELAVDLMPREMTYSEYINEAERFYNEGADNICFWDTHRRHIRLKEWHVLSRLGDRSKLSQLRENEVDFGREIKLIDVGGYKVDEFPPMWAY